MKQQLFTLALLMASVTGFSQTDTVAYYFKEVGMSIRVPSSFKAVSAAENEKLRLKGKKVLEEANAIQMDASATKNLLTVNQGQFNYLNITVTAYESKSQQEWVADNKEVKNMMYNSFAGKLTPQQIDTASRPVIIDGVQFDEFEMTLRINSSITMKMLLLGKYYKGYDFGIAYTYLDDAIGRQLSQMITSARFKN